MAKKKITIIMTGGTIDSRWDPSADTAVPMGESILPDYFKKLNLDIEIEFNQLMMKDSRALDTNDVEKIFQFVDSSSANKILITHGTYTMPDTARYLEKHLKSPKAIVLTGSMTPLKGYDMSDAGFNLGFSVATLLNLDAGVRLVMQGRVFTPDEVAKNMAEGRFFSLDG